MNSSVDSLEDIAEVVDSLHKTPSYVEYGFPMVRVTDVKYGDLDLSKTLRVNPDVYQEFSRRYKPNRGDIIITRVGTYGVFGKVLNTEFCLGQNTAAIVPKKISPDYLYAVLSSNFIKSQIESSVVGSTQKTLSLKAIKALQIPRLHLTQECLIGKFFAEFDDRITLLRETNTTLEAIAQALFKSWFVDFDPVRAKSEGKLPEGMDEATAALFPDAFEETDFGMVPKGWSYVPFGQLINQTIGGDWGSDVPDEKNDTRVAIIRGTDMPDLQAGTSNRVPIRFTTQKKLATRKLEDGDLVIEVSGGSKEQPTGRSLQITAALLDKFDCPVEPASFCRLMRPTNKKISTQLTQHLNFIYAQGKTWEYQNQSTGIANFQTNHFLQNEMVVHPTESVSDAFSSTVQALMDRAQTLEIQMLSTLRDTLLPRLISGQLRIADAEAELEKVTA